MGELFDRPISQRSAAVDTLKEQIFSLWRDYEGPMENIFRCLSYIVPFVPSLGWAIFIIESIASYFGLGLSSLGAWIDRQNGWGPSSSVEIGEDQLRKALEQIASKAVDYAKSSNDQEQLKKIAILGGLFKMTGAIPRVASLLSKAINFILLSFGMSKIGDMYNKTFRIKKDKGVANEDVEKDDKKSTTMDPEALLQLLDPKQLTNILIQKGLTQ